MSAQENELKIVYERFVIPDKYVIVLCFGLYLICCGRLKGIRSIVSRNLGGLSAEQLGDRLGRNYATICSLVTILCALNAKYGTFVIGRGKIKLCV